MKKKILLIFLVSLISLSPILAQKKNKLSIEINYGLNGNFFVRDYDELGGPVNKKYFYKKNFIGTISGIELKKQINKVSNLSIGYARSINKGSKDYFGNVNGVYVLIDAFNIRHTNDFYQLGYERKFKKSNPQFTYHLGLVYARMQQQEIQFETYDNIIVIQERNYKNSKLEEAGVFGGFQFVKKVDTKFTAGLRLRGYFLISTGTLEAIVFTPTLSYKF